MLESTPSATYEDVLKLFEELKGEFRKVEISLGESLESCHSQLGQLTSKLNAQTEEIVSLRSQVQTMASENKSLRGTVHTLEARVEELEQYSRKNTIEIHGIPVNNGENVVSIVQDVGKVLGVNIDDTMIDACHRLRATSGSSRAPGIIVKMVRRTDAEAIITKRREKRTYQRDISEWQMISESK